jgi:hypothetical protein
MDDKITYDDIIKCVAMLEAAAPPAPSILIWPNLETYSIFPEFVWMEDK